MKFLDKGAKKKKGRKGQMGLAGFVFVLVSIVIAFVMIGVVLPIGATITASIGDTAAAGSIAENVSNQTLTGLNTLGSWLPNVQR